MDKVAKVSLVDLPRPHARPSDIRISATPAPIHRRINRRPARPLYKGLPPVGYPCLRYASARRLQPPAPPIPAPSTSKHAACPAHGQCTHPAA